MLLLISVQVFEQKEKHCILMNCNLEHRSNRNLSIFSTAYQCRWNFKRVSYIKGDYGWNALSREKLYEKPKYLPGFKPEDPWIQGRDVSQFTAEKPKAITLRPIANLPLIRKDFTPRNCRKKRERGRRRI